MIYYSKNVNKTSEERRFKKRTCIFTYKITLGEFSFPACAYQPPGFSVRGTSTLYGLLQIINGLKRLMGYFKRLHQL